MVIASSFAAVALLVLTRQSATSLAGQPPFLADAEA
jgi:hypothetical protein